MKSKLFISLTLLITFSACTFRPRPASSQSPNINPPVELTSTSTNVPVVSPTPSSTATGLVTNWDKSKNCVTEYSQRPDGNQLEGVAVLRSLSSTTISLNLSLLDLKNGNLRDIDTANQSVWDLGVSPDGYTLAYSWFNNAASRRELVLVDNGGNLQEVAWSSDQEFGFQGWLNDHQLVVVQDSDYIIVDPYQDSQLRFSPSDFPDFNLYHSDFFVAFDPLLSRAIYRNSKINILDLSTNTIIAHIKDGYDRTPTVSWQPSGERAAVVATLSLEQNSYVLPDEIFIVEKDGELRQLTHLHDRFGLVLTIDSLSWSPDGSKIAFWLHDEEANLTLMITDYKTGDTVNYCILNVPAASFPISVPAPIWSPDGKYLMVENRYATDKNKVLIVDIANSSAFTIAENASPVGWMIGDP